MEQIEDEQMRYTKLVELASKVVDALCDEALKIAIDIGVDDIAAVGGINTLVTAIVDHVRSSRTTKLKNSSPLAARRMANYLAREKSRW